MKTSFILNFIEKLRKYQMKKLLVLPLTLLVLVFATQAEKRWVENLRIAIGPNEKLGGFELATSPLETRVGVPSYNLQNSPIGKFLVAADPVQNLDVAFITRYHPFPTNQNQIDTARIIYNVNDPDNTSDWVYIGDTFMPVNVVDAQGNTVFKLNGYFQMIPSVSFFYPQLENGEFVIDTVSFFLHSYPNSPITNSFIFSVSKANHLNMPNFGTDKFNPFTFDADYYKDVYDKLQDAIEIPAKYINERIEPTGSGGYTIKSTVIPLEKYSTMNTYRNNDRIMILITKDNLSDLRDTVNIVGTWEWTTPYQFAYAGTIRHYGFQRDSISFMSATVAPRRPAQNSPYYNEWLQKYPAFMNEQYVRKNYRMVVVGRYTGEFNPNAVRELNNFSESFELFQNAPNPVVNSTKIRFNLKEPGFVTLKVYNSMGELVATLVNEFMNSGEFESNFDTNGLPAGSYFYTLSTDKFSKSLPMIITK